MLKQIVLAVLLFFGLVKVGYSLRCKKCSGDLQQCNYENTVRDVCLPGQDKCASVVMNSESGMQFLFGCANEVDCMAAKSMCTQQKMYKEMEEIPGFSCNATCCDSDECVQPYTKDYKPFECYDCNSMDGCKTAKLKTCGEGEDRCFKISTEVTYKDPNVVVKTYSKGCARKSVCETKNIFYSTCKNDEEKCHMSCCEGSKCNAGSHVVISALTVLACAVFTVIVLQ